MTKWVAIEGSAILSQEHPKAKAILGKKFNEVTNWIHNPGISLLQESIILREFQINLIILILTLLMILIF